MNINKFHENTVDAKDSMRTRWAKIFKWRLTRGWPYLEWLAEWLNKPLPDEEREITLEAIRLIRAMDGAEAEVGSKTRKRLHAILSQLPAMRWAVVHQDDEVWALDLHHDKLINLIFEHLSGVTRAGLLERLQQCRKCGRWFGARRAKKVFCSPDCQADFWEAYRKTPAGRKEQRERMRRARASKRTTSRTASKQKSKSRRFKR